MFAKLLSEVVHDVSIEPNLTPLAGEIIPSGSNKSDEARLDIAAREFWDREQKVFFDVRIFNPFAQKHLNQSLNIAFNQNEREKKRQYNQRVVQVERGSFIPIVFSAYGGLGREINHFVSALLDRLAEKCHLEYNIAMNWIRTKISFMLLRSRLLCVRGSRALWSKINIDTVDIELSNSVSTIKNNLIIILSFYFHFFKFVYTYVHT